MATTTDRDTVREASGRLPAYRPPQGHRLREVARGLLSVVAALAIVVGIPLGLIFALGSPVPTSMPSQSTLTGELDPISVLRILSVVVWLAWAHFVVCLIVEWRSERRGVGLPTHVPLGGGSQAVARRLVASILLLAGAAVLAAPFSSGGGVPAPRPATATSSTQAGADAVDPVVLQARDAVTTHEQARTADTAAKVFYDVAPPQGRHHDSLWDIAERYLGDGRRYKEIFDLNAGRDQPDGSKLQQAKLIRPGWVLRMPADASGPGLRVEQPPAIAPGPSGQGSGGQGGGSQEGGSSSESAGATTEVAATTEARGGWFGTNTAIGASLLAAGLLASLRRTRGATPAAPEETGVEESLRLAADESGAAFLDQALRGLVPLSAETGQALPEVYAACLGHDRLILSLSPARTDAPAPWTASEDGRSWTINRTDIEGVEVPDDVLAPYPGLACFGDQDGWRMLFDLESAPGVVSLGGDALTARDVAASVAVELATNPWSDSVRVTLVGFGDALDGLAPGRLRHADRLEDVLPEIEARLARQVSAGGDQVLRGRGERPDRALWAPEFIVLSAPPHPGELALLGRLTAHSRRPCGVVTVGDAPGARWRFVVSSDGRLDTGVLGLTLDAQRLPVESYRSLVPLFAGTTTSDESSGSRSAADVVAEAVSMIGRTPMSAAPEPAAKRLPERHLDLDAPMPVEVRLLGEPAVAASGPLEAARLELATELVALLALSPEGVHPNVIASALWPRGVAEDVRDATLAHAQGWLGRDSAGRPRLRQESTGRWVLDQDVRCDWQVFKALADQAEASNGPTAADSLRERALCLVRGPVFEGLPSGRYSWLGRLGADRDMRAVVVSTAHSLAVSRLDRGDHAGAAEAARSGLRLLPESELLWRDVLRAGAAAGDREALTAVAGELYEVLGRRRVAKAEAETDALVDELLPGYRRRAA